MNEEEQPEPIIHKPDINDDFADGHHVDDAHFLHGIKAYGHVDPQGSLNIMSVKLNYLDAEEPIAEENLRTIKFWMYRNDAIAFAEGILRSAKRPHNSGLESLLNDDDPAN
jgi:hypothetical protein